MALPVSFIAQTLYDNTVKSNGTPESTSWLLPVTTLTAANYVAKKVLIDALVAAIANFTLGSINQNTVTIDRELVSTLPAASALAQRENKLLLRYHDATTFQKFQVSVGTFDLSQLMAHSEFIDLTAGYGLTLKTQFELIVVSPDDETHAVILDSGQFVGRNS